MAMNKEHGLNLQGWRTLKLSKQKSSGSGERECGVTLEDTVGVLVLRPVALRGEDRCGLGPVTAETEHCAGCQEVLAVATALQGAPYQAWRESPGPELVWCHIQGCGTCTWTLTMNLTLGTKGGKGEGGPPLHVVGHGQDGIGDDGRVPSLGTGSC